jgi:hypothetical protein
MSLSPVELPGRAGRSILTAAVQGNNVGNADLHQRAKIDEKNRERMKSRAPGWAGFLAILAGCLETDAFSLGLRGTFQPLHSLDRRSVCARIRPSSYCPSTRTAVTMSAAPRIPAWDSLFSMLPLNKRRKTVEAEVIFQRDQLGNSPSCQRYASDCLQRPCT